MHNDETTPPPSLNEYVAASAESSGRARAVFALLITISLVTAVGVRNSEQSAWMMERFQGLKDAKLLSRTPCRATTPYWKVYIGCPAAGEGLEQELYKERYTEIADAASSALIESRLLVHAPVLGVAIDVNDLGYFTGSAIVVLFIWFIFVLRSERRNLGLTLHEAERRSTWDLATCYKQLAMRQVFTYPPMPFEGVSKYGVPMDSIAPKVGPRLLTFLPVAVYGWLVVHDVMTMGVPKSLDAEVIAQTVTEVCFTAWIGYLTIRALNLGDDIDGLWSAYANKIAPQSRSTTATSPKAAS